MAEKEVEMTISLREVVYVSRKRRSSAAVSLLRTKVARFMKVPSDNVWIDDSVNKFIWKRGIEKPPRKLRVKILKLEEDNSAEVLLPDQA
ncbi:MAG: 50S ribosomal protein L31e [Candidatus Thermoplasmatota archaeon]|jgi:large subunit ribosomal protein L31e|nr:50S ribosomal protein L31e [Candidatus Thermoplasmatota archaeon]